MKTEDIIGIETVELKKVDMDKIEPGYYMISDKRKINNFSFVKDNHTYGGACYLLISAEEYGNPMGMSYNRKLFGKDSNRHEIAGLFEKMEMETLEIKKI